ncbi:DMT family transporter [Erythrobacteraceae bacterium E2-1 Yellow Sea]|nr:DMT family transporter [Erythrobacteraceae bacterium E2-1 Yellow Sea]
MNLRTLLILLLCNIVWALNIVVSKIVVGDLAVPPLFYACARSGMVALALIFLLRPLPRQLGKVFWVGLAIGGGSFALLFVGLQTASPSTAGVINLLSAPVTVLFAMVFLGERVRWRRGLGIFLTLVGVFIATGSPSGISGGIGVAYLLAAAVFGALGAVFFKQIEIDARAMLAWSGLASVVVLAPLSFLLEQHQFDAVMAAPMEFTAALLFASIVVSVGAHTAYYRVLQQNDANLVVPLTLLTPLMTIGFGAWITNDPIGWQLILGGALAIIGVAIIVLRPSSNIFKPLLVRSRL